MTLSIGPTYQQSFLDKQTASHIMLHVVTKKPYGYHIKIVTSFASTRTIKLVINSNGTAKATMKVDPGYQAPYQYTLYYDKQGCEILTSHLFRGTREELKHYQELNK